MSMQDYAFADYGLLLDEDAEEEILARTDYENIAQMAEDDQCSYQFSFTGESCPILDDGSVVWGEGETYMGDDIFYIACDKEPRLVGCAYHSVDEIVEEMREKMQDYLPADFDYRGHLRYIVGTYYG